MTDYKLVSRGSLGLAGVIFLVYFAARISDSARVPVDLYSLPAMVMFPLLLVLALLVGVGLMIESELFSQ